MKPTLIKDVYELNIKKFEDSRGYFQSIFKKQEETGKIWGDRSIKQVNLSNNYEKGTIRGLHYQKEPLSECKLITCISGSIWDVAVDLRRDSLTYGKYTSCKLTKDLSNALLIPEGCAHGFQCLEASSQLLYIHSEKWDKNAESGIRWDDPCLNINWPLPPINMSTKDLNLPFFQRT